MDLQVTAAKLTGDPERDVKALSNHVFQLEEQLRYQLRNLDVTNFNDLGLARYENGRLQVYAKQVEIQTEKLRVELGKQIEGVEEGFASLELEVGGLKATVEGYEKTVDGYEKQVSTFNQTVTGFNTTVTNYGNAVNGYAQQVSSFNQTVSGFNTTVTNYGNAVNGYAQQVTSFEQTASKIALSVKGVADTTTGNVTAASIVAAINDTEGASKVMIKADHIQMTGTTAFLTATDLSDDEGTTINGKNIRTGEIRAINFIAEGDVESNDISNSFVIEDGGGYSIGKIGYTWVEDDGRRGDKIYIVAESYYIGSNRYRPCVKILGEGGVSIETGSGDAPVYISSAGSYITIDAPEIYIRDNIGTEWWFYNGSLYKNGNAVL